MTWNVLHSILYSKLFTVYMTLYYLPRRHLRCIRACITVNYTLPSWIVLDFLAYTETNIICLHLCTLSLRLVYSFSWCELQQILNCQIRPKEIACCTPKVINRSCFCCRCYVSSGSRCLQFPRDPPGSKRWTP